MKRNRSVAVGLLVGLVLSVVAVKPVQAEGLVLPEFKANFLIPAYFYPSANRWQNLCASLRSHGYPAAVIMNPNSGPGTAVNSDYTAAVASCHQRPVAQKVLGYVYTDYGNRPAADVRADVDRYYSWYQVNGIFFDEMSNQAATKPYYLDIYNYVRSKSVTTLVVGNPGIPASTGWQLVAPAVADVLVVFEGTAKTYSTWSPPAWITSIKGPPLDRLAHLVYAARPPGIILPPSTLPTTQAVCAASKLKKGGWMDVSPDGVRGSNPWDTAPDLAGMLTYC